MFLFFKTLTNWKWYSMSLCLYCCRLQWSWPRWWGMWVPGRWSTCTTLKMAASTSWSSTPVSRWSIPAPRWSLTSTSPLYSSRWETAYVMMIVFFLYLHIRRSKEQDSFPTFFWWKKYYYVLKLSLHLICSWNVAFISIFHHLVDTHVKIISIDSVIITFWLKYF